MNYRVTTTKGEILEIVNPNHLPAPNYIVRIEEPYITATIITRDEYLGGLLKLCEERSGTQKSLEYLAANRVVLTYDFPLNEVVLDFYDKLKSISKGYASFDYEFAGLPGGRSRQARPAGQRRPGRRALPHRPPGARPPRRAAF